MRSSRCLRVNASQLNNDGSNLHEESQGQKASREGKKIVQENDEMVSTTREPIVIAGGDMLEVAEDELVAWVRLRDIVARTIYESKLCQPAHASDPWDGAKSATKNFCRQAANDVLAAIERENPPPDNIDLIIKLLPK